MKRFFLWVIAILSGLYVLLGPIPDFLFLVDEATALLIFVKCMKALGYDVTRFIPFMSKGKKKADAPESKGTNRASETTVDV